MFKNSSLLILSLSFTVAPFAAGQEDPILKLDSAYQAEADSVALETFKEKLAHGEKWIAQFRQAIEENPNSPAVDLARVRIGNLLKSIGRVQEATELWKRMLESDPIHNLHAEYEEAQRREGLRDRPREEREAFYEAWLERFEKVASENPYSPWLYSAADARLELYNVFSRREDSIRFMEGKLDRLVNYRYGLVGAESKRVDLKRASLLCTIGRHAGEASLLNRHFQHDDKDLFRKSIENFHAARELFAEYEDIRGLYSTYEGEGTTVRLLTEEHLRAAELYMKAYELLPRMPEAERQRLSDPSGESLLRFAAKLYARAGDARRSLEIFEELDALPESDHSRARTLRGILNAGVSADADLSVLCPFVESWLLAHPDHRDAPALAGSLAVGWSHAGEGAKAVKSFERYFDYVEKSDADFTGKLSRLMLDSHISRLVEQGADPARVARLRERFEAVSD